MKKIFSIALAATLLAAGCQKTEVIGLDDSKTGPAMTFSTEMKKITKGTDDATTGGNTDGNQGTTTPTDGDLNLQKQGFNIWAYADFSAEDLENSTNVDKTSTDDRKLIYDGMYNLHVSYDKDKLAWDPGKEYYWPGQGKNLKFFAVSAPMSGNALPCTVEIESGIEKAEGETDAPTPSMTITGFTVPNGDPNVTSGAQGPNVDLMVADFRKQNQEQNQKVVALNFRHTLSKVEFVFKTNESPYKEGNTTEFKDNATKVFVQKIEVKDLYDQGTLTVSPSAATASSTTSTDNAVVTPVQSAWTALSYSTSNSTKTFSAIYKDVDSNFPTSYQDANGNTHTTSATTNDNKALLLTTAEKTFATWLMIPQAIKVDEVKAQDGTITSGAVDRIVEITYVINGRQFVSKFSLGGRKSDNVYQVPSWGVNQYIKYTINLSPNLITFEAVTDDWNPNTGTNVEHQN
jgi:hypothetical protein